LEKYSTRKKAFRKLSAAGFAEKIFATETRGTQGLRRENKIRKLRAS
jgi:hypothetical protein